MLSALPRRCTVGACVAFALLSTAPVFAQKSQTKTTTTTKDKNKGAPAPAAAPAASASTAEAPKEEKSDEEKEKDEKEPPRAIFFSGDIAFTRVDLGGIHDNTGFDRTAANGLLYGFAGGLRLKGLRFGARWRVFETTEYNLWSVAGSIGYGLPIKPLQPILSVNAGYVWDQKLNQSVFSSSLPPGTVLPPQVNVNGFLLGVDLNAAYWLTKFLRMGAFIGSDFMFLHRGQAALPASIFPIPEEFRQKPLYTGSGSGIAYTINIGLRGAFDIDF